MTFDRVVERAPAAAACSLAPAPCFAWRGTVRGLREQLLTLLGWDPPASCGATALHRTVCGERPLNCAPPPERARLRAATAHPRALPAPPVAAPGRRPARRAGDAVGAAHRQPHAARRQHPGRPGTAHHDAGPAPRSPACLRPSLHGVRAGVHGALGGRTQVAGQPAARREPRPHEVGRGVGRASLPHRSAVDARLRRRRRPGCRRPCVWMGRRWERARSSGPPLARPGAGSCVWAARVAWALGHN